MSDNLTQAAKLIIARCSAPTGEEAIRLLAAVRANSPMVQTRYQVLLIRALADPEADFTPAERETLAAGIEPQDGSGSRDFTLRVRLNSAEQASLQVAAEAAGMSMSEYVRSKLF